MVSLKLIADKKASIFFYLLITVESCLFIIKGYINFSIIIY